MRRFERKALDAKVEAYLSKKQAEVNGHVSPKDEGKRLWEQSRDTQKFKKIESCLRHMNGNTAHCMYCDANEATEIDHFHPKAQYTHKTFDWHNYFLSCGVCNRRKLDQFPVDDNGTPLLIDPVTEDPHPELPYALVLGSYRENDATLRGKACIDVFGLNRDHLITTRQREYRNLKCKLEKFLLAERAGELIYAQELLIDILFPPLVGLLQELIYVYSRSSDSLDPPIQSALSRLQTHTDPRVRRLFSVAGL